jgi:pantetheine-phosphate adenylyltransferase
MAASPGHQIAVYTGVFDPIHLGHLDVIRRGSRIFERLVVGVGNNPEKTPFFTIEERVELIKRVVTPYHNVEVRPFTGMAVRFVGQVGSRVILRGLRTLSDMESEFSMSLTNLALDAEIETVFLMAKEEYSHISSTLIRQIATFQDELSEFVPPEVKKALQARVRERQSMSQE